MIYFREGNFCREPRALGSSNFALTAVVADLAVSGAEG